MNYDQPIIETIRKRRSWRTFENRLVPDDILTEIIDAVGDFRGPRGNLIRIQVLHWKSKGPEKLGTYGTISGASTFLAGAVEQSETSAEDFGYIFEKIILKATEMGLGTCWLGGTFSRGAFTDRMKLKTGELLMAVTPVGYPAVKRAAADRITVALARSERRLSGGRLFYSGDFATPRPIGDEDAYSTALESVRVGPSASNKQPWRILEINGVFHFYLRRNPGYARMSELGGIPDLQRSDLGIAMAHFELSVRELGYYGTWSQDDPGLSPDKQTVYIATWNPDSSGMR